jgi:hypothetical protein
MKKLIFIILITLSVPLFGQTEKARFFLIQGAFNDNFKMSPAIGVGYFNTKEFIMAFRDAEDSYYYEFKVFRHKIEEFSTGTEYKLLVENVHGNNLMVTYFEMKTTRSNIDDRISLTLTIFDDESKEWVEDKYVGLSVERSDFGGTYTEF